MVENDSTVIIRYEDDSHPQTERVEVPKSILSRGDTFALRVKGSSIALVNGEATIKT